MPSGKRSRRRRAEDQTMVAELEALFEAKLALEVAIRDSQRPDLVAAFDRLDQALERFFGSAGG